MPAAGLDLMHPLYRQLLAPLEPGMRDVWGAMLSTAGFSLEPALPLTLAHAAILSALHPPAVAYPFSLAGPFRVEGVLVLREPGVLALAGALLGEPNPPALLEDLHVPMLRDLLANTLGRWQSTLAEQYGEPFEVLFESPLNPLEAAVVLRDGPLGGHPEVALERIGFVCANSRGMLELVFAPATIETFITHHPDFVPPEDVPMATTPPAPTPAPAPEPVSASRAQFQQIQAHPTADYDSRGLDMLMDVPLTISVELGRQDLNIRHILELSPGSLVELDRLAGEPLDLLINGKLFAKGEVVVIDENFGIRIVSIISPEDRLQSLR